MTPRIIIPVVALLATAAACDSTEALRFRDQIPWYRFEGLPYVVEVHGARLLQTTATVEADFNCPLRQDGATGEVAKLLVEATSPTPLISVSHPSKPYCDEIAPVGIELRGLPFGTVDVYRRCSDGALDRYVTQCENVVESCTGDTDACVRVIEGRYRLTATSEYLDDPFCISESFERDPFAISSEACDVCNALDGMEVSAAVRGEVPDGKGCCAPDAEPTIVFCAKPCACRRTVFRLEAKDPPQERPLRIAILSDVESHRDTFRAFVANAVEKQVDLVVNIGDLTESGGQSDVRDMGSFVTEALQTIDGAECAERNGLSCCVAGSRQHEELCNALLPSPLFTNGLGQNETSAESFYTFFETFGPSNATALIGRVQLIVLDSADATLSAPQFDWLEEVLRIPEPLDESCRIDGEPPDGQWPLLSECAVRDCNQCIGVFASCVPPPAGRASNEAGPANCLCIPASSKTCPGNFACVANDDGTSACRCSRDSDCGPGYRCREDGSCEPPLRLFFTHTPPFDVFGARNSAFLSRREAAVLVAQLLRGEVKMIFAGAINTFSEVKVAGIPCFVTGGGGADMEIFDETGHHYLLVTIPDAYTQPDVSRVTIETVQID